jgi:hypothetical protein
VGLGVDSSRATPPPAEQKLIEQLIRDVSEMHDLVFIRNGAEYDSKEAVAHLREKYAYFRSDIQTADDFIRLCATKSEMTGRAYRVRDAKGVEKESAVFLYEHLAHLRMAANAAAASAPPGAAAPAH